MKILKFRIKNYKSIIDSEDCYLEENITILAGKNESDKTAILEALDLRCRVRRFFNYCSGKCVKRSYKQIDWRILKKGEF